MELHHLRRFSVLAKELHFTRAAECLHIEQSPLSRTIKELEGELGVLLFSRGRRGTQLTKAGNIFYVLRSTTRNLDLQEILWNQKILYCLEK